MPPLSSSSSILRDAEYTPTRKPLSAASTALLIVDVPVDKALSRYRKRDFPGFPDKLQSTISHCRNTNAKIIWVVSKKESNTQISQLSLLNDRSRKRRRICGPQQLEMLPTPRLGDIVVKKQGLSGTSNTNLLRLLREHNIDTVLVCGLWTSVSVQHTAFGVFESGFRTLLVQDACADFNKARHEAAISLYGNYMYELAESSDLEPTNIHGLWHKTPSLPSVVSETEMASQLEETSEESSIATTAEVSSASSSSSNSIYSPIVFPKGLQTIATIQQRVALSTR